MKRSTKQNVGIWPNMRDDTLKAISDELIRARKKHPDNAGNVAMLETCIQSLRMEMRMHHAGRMSAQQVFARAAQIAAMAIRVLEEGTYGFKYSGSLLKVNAPKEDGALDALLAKHGPTAENDIAD